MSTPIRRSAPPAETDPTSGPDRSDAHVAKGPGSTAARAIPSDLPPGRSGGATSSPDRSRVGRPGRSPDATVRLGRLRTELGRIVVLPFDAEQARGEIVDALARAGLADWTVPALEDPEKSCRLRDGTVRIDLLSHVVLLNPWGAFRIEDKQWPTRPYFELRGRGNKAFVSPPAA